MITDFLSPAQKKQIAILHDLFANLDDTQFILTNHLDFSEAKLNYYVSNINHDALTLFSRPLIKVHNNYYTVDSDDSPLYHQLQIYYLKNSLPYQLCAQVITHQHLNLSALCEQLAISQSHIYRLVKKLNTILVSSDIQLTLNNQSIPVFIGNELNIRLFIFSFVKQCFDFDEWPFPTLKKDHVIATFESISHTRLDYPQSKYNSILFLSVVMLRIANNYSVDALTPKNQSLLALFVRNDKNQVHQLLFKTASLTVAQKDTEFLYLNFFSHVLLPNIISEHEIIVIGETITKHQDIPPYNFLHDTIIHWQQNYHISMSDVESYKLQYFYLMFYILAFTIKLDTLTVWSHDSLFLQYTYNDVSSQHKSIVDFIQKEFQTLQKDYPADTDTLPTVILTYFASTLLFASNMYETHHITIYIHFSTDPSIKLFIEKQLKNIYKDSVITFVENNQLAKLIITDSIEMTLPSKKNIVIRNILSKSEFQHILDKINEIVVEDYHEY